MMPKKYLILFFFLSLLTSSCNDENKIESQNLAVCDETNTVFNQLYNNVLNTSPNVEEVTMDSTTHGYTFEVTAPATICKVGYSSQPTFEAIPFEITIFNNTTNTLVYSGNHTFSSTNTEYVSITPVDLTVGHSYTIRRNQNDFTILNPDICIGRLVCNPSTFGLNYPISFGILKIIGPMYDLEGMEDAPLPYIDIVFES